MRQSDSHGFSLIELVFVAALASTLTAVAIPEGLAALDEFRAAGATRYVAARIARVRMDAVVRSADVALRFVLRGSEYEYTVVVDGNRNGVTSRDIQRGIDREILPAERLADQFPGVTFGVLPDLPPVDAGGAPPGADPIKLGAGSLLTFSAQGTSSSGSVYIRGQGAAQYVIRVFGGTGKVRILKYDARNRQWRTL